MSKRRNGVTWSMHTGVYNCLHRISVLAWCYANMRSERNVLVLSPPCHKKWSNRLLRTLPGSIMTKGFYSDSFASSSHPSSEQRICTTGNSLQRNRNTMKTSLCER